MAIHTKLVQVECLFTFRNAAKSYSANYLINSSSFVELVR